MDIKETIAEMKGIPTQDDLIKDLQMQVATVTFLKLDAILAVGLSVRQEYRPDTECRDYRQYLIVQGRTEMQKLLYYLKI